MTLRLQTTNMKNIFYGALSTFLVFGIIWLVSNTFFNKTTINEDSIKVGQVWVYETNKDVPKKLVKHEILRKRIVEIIPFDKEVYIRYLVNENTSDTLWSRESLFIFESVLIRK